MKRRLRWSANVASLFCLLTAAVSAIAWARSSHGTRDRLDLWPRFGPYEVSSADGRICLAALPKADRHGAEVLRSRLARHTNRVLPWLLIGPDLSPWPSVVLFRPNMRRPLDPLPPDLAECLSANKGGTGLDRQLFDALGDPDRFALAHAMLLLMGKTPGDTVLAGGISSELRLTPTGIQVFCEHLRIEVPYSGDGWEFDPLQNVGKPFHYEGPATCYDPTQIPELREYWFTKLARPVASVRWSTLTFIMALPPLVWLALRMKSILVSRRRRRVGLCHMCGYDLTGNMSGRCSECGAAAPTTHPHSKKGEAPG